MRTGFLISTAVLFWPLYLPLLLSARAAQCPTGEVSSKPKADEMAAAIAQVELELDAALSSLDGWAEDALACEQDRIAELRHALAAQATRIRDMDELLSRTEASEIAASAKSTISGLAAGEALERWQKCQQARAQNLSRLAQVRRQAHADLMATLAWIRELVSMIHLAKFTGAPASRAKNWWLRSPPQSRGFRPSPGKNPSRRRNRSRACRRSFNRRPKPRHSPRPYIKRSKTMGIFRRTADVFAANLNDFVDRFEEPQRMLRYALREMESLVSATSAAVARSIATERLLEKTSAEHASQADEWQRRATASIDEGDEVLARRAIARQLNHRRAQAGTDLHLTDARDANETLRRQLDSLRDKHAAARTRLMTLAARQTAADAHRQVLGASRSPVGQARSLLRFDRFYEQAEFAHAEAAARIELETDGDAALETEFDRRATERTIDDELARLKASRHPAQA